jgi:hypothetical protein
MEFPLCGSRSIISEGERASRKYKKRSTYAAFVQKVLAAEEKITVRKGSKTALKLSKMKSESVIAPAIDVVPSRVSRLLKEIKALEQ